LFATHIYSTNTCSTIHPHTPKQFHLIQEICMRNLFESIDVATASVRPIQIIPFRDGLLNMQIFINKNSYK
jgi:hypothetical protein